MTAVTSLILAAVALVLVQTAQAAVSPDWKYKGVSAKDVPQMILFTVRFD
jgi:hypothetical protein